MQMPFGKFKNCDIEEIPSSYLNWIMENLEIKSERDEKLLLACEEEYFWRKKFNCHFEK